MEICLSWDQITIGNYSKNIYDGVTEAAINKKHFEDKKQAAEYIRGLLKPGDVITLKASNGMKFSELVELLK